MRAQAKSKTSRRLSFPEREARILEAAIDLFSKNGFNGTTTRAIARQAGVNEALLFRHFKSKEEMYCALLRKKFNDFETEAHGAFQRAKAKPFEKALVDVAKLMIEKNRQDPALFRVMLYSSLENHELSRLFLKHRLPIITFLEELFKERISDGTLRLQNPAVLARAFLALVSHYVLISQIFRAPEFYPVSETSLIQSYVSILARGVVA